MAPEHKTSGVIFISPLCQNDAENANLTDY